MFHIILLFYIIFKFVIILIPINYFALRTSSTVGFILFPFTSQVPVKSLRHFLRPLKSLKVGLYRIVIDAPTFSRFDSALRLVILSAQRKKKPEWIVLRFLSPSILSNLGIPDRLNTLISVNFENPSTLVRAVTELNSTFYSYAYT